VVADTSGIAVDRPPSLVEDRPSERLKPYVPRLAVDWLRHHPERTYHEVEGSLAFVDISGFTKLTERLARKGKVGAEEMSDTLNATFAALLDVAYQDGAGLVKWGGDAVLLLFEGPLHAKRAARAAHRMRATMRQVGQLQTSAGRVTLRMSVGIHSGTFHFFLVGDPTYHRELIVSGPAASLTAVMEATADAGEIGLSPATAALLDRRCVGQPKGEALLLRGEPDIPTVGVPPVKDVHHLDLAGVLPVAIREHLLAQPGEAEHRTIAVAFVQFSGTDALLEREGPQALADALHETMANVQQATASHGVTFFETDINRDGGKIMLTAGAPVSHGHEEDRMLRAARLIIERAGTLPLRIGVNRGPVFSGDFGPFFRRTYSVKGDAINLAARVMGKAAPGEVLATQATLDRARSAFALEPLPPFMVKGKSQPVHAVRVGPLAGAGHRTATFGDTDLPLVGREAEMEVLTTALDDARQRRGRLVELIGEPGIGKSRLVAELRRLSDDVDVLYAACEEYESTTPYFPFRALLRSLLALPVDVTPEAAYRRLQERVAVNAPGLLPWLPLVGVPIDLPFPETQETRRLDPRFRKSRVEEVTTQLLALLLPTPTLLVFDDVHLMDDASVDLLGHLVADVAQHPWLVLSTRRDNQPDGYRAEPGQATEVRPRPLDGDAALALVSASTEHAPLPPHEMEVLARRAGGNPLFLRGLVLAAQQTGSIESLPETVEDLITAQIDRLSPSERTLLRYASVLGVTFETEQLEAMLVGEPVAADPQTLRRLQVFLLPGGPGRYVFRHALIRDAAYEGLPFRQRRRLHDRVGTTLESGPGAPHEQPELLSLHFLHAGRLDKAWHYARIAGERAAAKFAYVEAAELFARAVAAGRGLPHLPPAELAVVQAALGDAQFRVGVMTDARSSFRAARSLVRDDPLWTADLLRREAEVDQRLNQLTQALRTLSRAMALLERADGDDPSVRAEHSRLQGFYAVVRQNQGRYRESLRWGRRAEATAVAAGDRRALADAYEALHGASAMLGIEQEEPYGELALALYEELDDRAEQSKALNNLAVLAWLEGRGTDAVDMFRRAETAAAEAGDTLGAASSRYNVGDVLLRQGHVDEAEGLLAGLLRVFRSLGAEDFHATTLRALGLARVLRGEVEEGHGLLVEARDSLELLGLSAEVVETDASLVEALLVSGSPAAAAAVAEAAIQRAHSLSAGYLLPTLHRLRGAALLDLGDLDQGEACLGLALRACEAQAEEIERGFILAELARAADARADDAKARELAAESERALARLGFVGSARYPRSGA
jgi:class 3 adenylate cyclase/tetratricopeptide (TPR) repeat protein